MIGINEVDTVLNDHKYTPNTHSRNNSQNSTKHSQYTPNYSSEDSKEYKHAMGSGLLSSPTSFTDVDMFDSENFKSKSFRSFKTPRSSTAIGSPDERFAPIKRSICIPSERSTIIKEPIIYPLSSKCPFPKKVDRCLLKCQELIIFPDTLFYKIWESVIIILLLYTLIVLPVRVSFEPEDVSKKMVWLDYTIDALFGIDIIINFMTAYETKSGHVEANAGKIIDRYLKTWFLVDLIAIIPWNLFGGANYGKAADTTRMLKLWKLTRLVKMTRAYRFREVLDKIYYSSAAPASAVRIGSLFLISMSSAHISACLWYFFANLNPDGKSWMKETIGGKNITGKSLPDLYGMSFYWALSTLTTVGYGDISPRNSAEIWWSITNMIIGTTFFAYMLGSVTSIITASDIKKNSYRYHMWSLRKFMHEKKLTHDLKNELTQHLKSKWKDLFRQDITWDEMRTCLDDKLQYRIITAAYGELIDSSQFFIAIKKHIRHRNEVYQTFVTELASAFQPHAFVNGEEFCRKGDKVLYWHLIASGAVELEVPSLENQKSLAKLDLKVDKDDSTWDTFGECGLFFGETWQVNVRATKLCEIYVVLLSRVAELLQEPPNRCIYDVMLEFATYKYDQLKKMLSEKDKGKILTTDTSGINNESKIDKLLQSRYSFIDARLGKQSHILDRKLDKQHKALDIMISRCEKMIRSQKKKKITVTRESSSILFGEMARKNTMISFGDTNEKKNQNGLPDLEL